MTTPMPQTHVDEIYANMAELIALETANKALRKFEEAKAERAKADRRRIAATLELVLSENGIVPVRIRGRDFVALRDLREAACSFRQNEAA